MFDILKIPNQISATLLRLSKKCLLFRTVCFEENGFLQKSEWEDSATCQDC